MQRKYIDCRLFPSESNCSLEIVADTEDEVLDVAVPHAVRTHGHNDTPELRTQLRSAIKSREEALT